MAKLPSRLRWLFWESDFGALDDRRDADFVLARVLEHGTLETVQWLMRHYGLAGIHRFFRTVGHPEISKRTRAFWRSALHAEKGRAAWRPAASVRWRG